MTFQRLKYGVLVATGIAVTGTLVWFADRPQIEAVDVIELVMGAQERLRAQQVLTGYPSNRVSTVTNSYVVWEPIPLVTNVTVLPGPVYVTNVVGPTWFSYGPWVTNVTVLPGPVYVTNITETVTTNLYQRSSGVYTQTIDNVTSLWPAVTWNTDYTFKVEDGRRFIYSGYSNYVVSGHADYPGFDGTYVYETSGITVSATAKDSYYDIYRHSFTTNGSTNFYMQLDWTHFNSQLANEELNAPLGVFYFADDNRNSRESVYEDTWSDFGLTATNVAIIGTNGIRAAYIRDVGTYTNLSIRDSLVIGVYATETLFEDLSKYTRQVCGYRAGRGGDLYGNFYPVTNLPVGSSWQSIIDLMYSYGTPANTFNYSGFADESKASSGKFDGQTDVNEFLIKATTIWKTNDLGPVMLYVGSGRTYVPYGGTSSVTVDNADVWFRFTDESTNKTSQYVMDNEMSPYLNKTNMGLRYTALYELGSWTFGPHDQTWTTNATGNQYVWTGAETSTYALAIADCIAATPVVTTNAASPYRYTLIAGNGTNWQATAYARMSIPEVTGMATSLTKNVDYYIQTTPKTAFYSVDGYVTNTYYRLPDESYSAANAYSHSATSQVGNVGSFVASEFQTNTGYYGWITGDVGPVLKWDFQYCTNAIP